MIDMSSIYAAAREDMLQTAWYENIFIDSNIWFNSPFAVCCRTFIELLSDNPLAPIVARWV